MVHTEPLILQGIQTKWILKNQLFGKGQAGRVFLGEEVISSNRLWPKQIGPGNFVFYAYLETSSLILQILPL